VYVGERVICQGKVIALEGDTVNVELTVATAERECMTGSARIVLPPAAEESDV
jgi:hypothetical protein